MSQDLAQDQATLTEVPERAVLELLRLRAYWRWAGAMTILRLPPLMFPMAMILISEHYTGSPALGGIVVAASMAPTIVVGPLAGRLLDRFGTAKWTPRLLAIGGIGRLFVAVGFVLEAHVAVLLVLAFVSSAATSGISGATIALLLNSLPERLVGPALSLDSVSAEIVSIGAPFLVALAVLAGPIFSLVAIGMAGVLAGLMMATSEVMKEEARSKALESEPDDQVSEKVKYGLLRNRRFLFWVMVTMAVGQVMGTTDLGAPAIAVESGDGAVRAALLLGVLGVTSAVSGLLYAWFSKSIKFGLESQAQVLLVLMIGSMLLISISPGWITAILAFAVLGFWVAPINTVMQEGPGMIVPSTRRAEAFNILVAAGVLGFAMVGGLLYVLPLSIVLPLGTVLPVVTLATAPFLLRKSALEPAVAPVLVDTAPQSTMSGHER